MVQLLAARRRRARRRGAAGVPADGAAAAGRTHARGRRPGAVALGAAARSGGCAWPAWTARWSSRPTGSKGRAGRWPLGGAVGAGAGAGRPAAAAAGRGPAGRRGARRWLAGGGRGHRRRARGRAGPGPGGDPPPRPTPTSRRCDRLPDATPLLRSLVLQGAHAALSSIRQRRGRPLRRPRRRADLCQPAAHLLPRRLLDAAAAAAAGAGEVAQGPDRAAGGRRAGGRRGAQRRHHRMSRGGGIRARPPGAGGRGGGALASRRVVERPLRQPALVRADRRRARGGGRRRQPRAPPLAEAGGDLPPLPGAARPGRPAGEAAQRPRLGRQRPPRGPGGLRPRPLGGSARRPGPAGRGDRPGPRRRGRRARPSAPAPPSPARCAGTASTSTTCAPTAGPRPTSPSTPSPCCASTPSPRPMRRRCWRPWLRGWRAATTPNSPTATSACSVWPPFADAAALRAKSAFPFRYHNGGDWPWLDAVYAAERLRRGLPGWRYPLMRWWEECLEHGWAGAVEHYSTPFGRGSLLQAWSSLPAEVALAYAGTLMAGDADPAASPALEPRPRPPPGRSRPAAGPERRAWAPPRSCRRPDSLRAGGA